MKTIIHIVDNLKRGGAETLLLEVVKGLKQYCNLIVTLTNDNDFTEQELDGLNIASLNFRSFKTLPFVVLRFRKLIAQYKPAFIHAHLPLSSLVARLARPVKVPLFISIHNNYSNSLKAVSPGLFLLEKLLHSKKEKLIFVSSAIQKDYETIIGIKGTSFVLYNFISDKYFDVSRAGGNKQLDKIKLIAVGSFKPQKNFETLLEAFRLLDHKCFNLDIYGDGPLRKKLEDKITQFSLYNIHLKGSVADIDRVLPHYDGFVLASKYEGFGLAPLEAAAIGLPLLLSDIEVFKEVTQGYATFFSPTDANDIAEKLQNFKNNYKQAADGAITFKPSVKETYSKESYMKRLDSIYKT